MVYHRNDRYHLYWRNFPAWAVCFIGIRLFGPMWLVVLCVALLGMALDRLSRERIVKSWARSQGYGLKFDLTSQHSRPFFMLEDLSCFAVRLEGDGSVGSGTIRVSFFGGSVTPDIHWT